jgi:hypothetical protein
MSETIEDSIRRLLRYQRAPDTATSILRRWKHNADILPKLQVQLETLLGAYGKFEPVVYDTQGIRDDGSDIILRCRQETGNKAPELISFQVKSFDDLAKSNYMQELKAQRDDSFRKVLGMNYYFLMLCTDSVAHKDRVRNIMAEFRSADRTEVIEPVFAYTFLLHPKARVEALVTRAMEAQDYVFRSALESLDDLTSPSARGLAVFIVVRWVLTGKLLFRVEELLADATLRKIYGELQVQQNTLLVNMRDPEDEPYHLYDFDQQLAEDLAILDSDIVVLDASSTCVRLEPNRVRSLVAITSDALSRYEYADGQLLEYMFNLMGIRD